MANPTTCPPLTRQSVTKAHELIRSRVHCTPVMTSTFMNQLASTPRKSAKPIIRLWFKCENLQRVGAFKVRGAFHAIERLKQEPGWLENGGLSRGVVSFSAGNHAQAVALAARESNMPAHIVMPETSSRAKIESVQGYGANLTISGRFDREAVAAQVVAKTGARLVPPYDHPDVILGQSSVGLELQSQVAKLDAIISPSSGGGLLSGTALSCEGTGIRVYGAEPEFEGADDGRRGFLSGKRITHVETSTIADGLVGKLGLYPWEIIYERRLVDMIYAVSEDEILDAMKLIFERLKLVVEPAAAVPLAVALYNEEFREMVEHTAGDAGWDVGIILSGGNIGTGRIAELFS
ncbi:threonine/serine dehydratase [Aspergillus alliaceus]|uniref:threonine/serine dehydratase n=1 Tax=Petromyces alliaceus TaxID=209559 RepID=UPI0012A598A6|nr:tryptophan synthase beta subunit-like PLP-dependent enzyme [Aspergillus alliaceus]KAB8236594.1 tryptophan synthase beta subunit-like PLP-dependent enzyme [Aspergillus alliaceus]